MPVLDSPVVKGLEFHYDDSPQHSPQWLAIKRGRIGASKVGDWLATGKQKNNLGKPLKKRLDYEKQLMFERQYNTNFEIYTNSAMDDGNDFEEWAAQQYAQIMGVQVETVGCWYNEWLAVSPDRKIVGVNGGIEIKILKDNKFTEVLSDGVIEDHLKQIKTQLWATGWDFIDYVPVNFNSHTLATIRVTHDTEFEEFLALSIQEQLVVEPFKTENIHPLIGDVPVGLVMPGDDAGGSSDGGW